MIDAPKKYSIVEWRIKPEVRERIHVPCVESKISGLCAANIFTERASSVPVNI